MTETNETARKSRPAKGETRAKDRPERHYAPIGEFRDLLNVSGGDEEFEYRWIMDTSASGQRVFAAYHAGWDFVDASKETGLSIGEHFVDRSDTHGSIFRRPANKHGDFLYLMRMPKDRYEEVQKQKQVEIDELECELQDPQEEGQYGHTRIQAHGEMRGRRDTAL